MNDFPAILYENSKIPFFDLKFLVSGPIFYELVTSKSFFLRFNWIGEHAISKPKKKKKKIYIYIYIYVYVYVFVYVYVYVYVYVSAFWASSVQCRC